MNRLLVWVCCTMLMTSAAVAAPIAIGLNADMSAVAAEGGKGIRLGALLAIEEINQQGGVLGRPLILQVRDHRGNPARGLANLTHFSRQPNLVAVIGGVHTPVVLHELPLIHERKVVFLDPWAAGTGIVDNGYTPNYVFRVSVRDEHAATVLIKRAIEKGYKQPGLLLERTGWGRSNQKSMSKAIEQYQLEMAGVQWFNWRETDLSSQVAELKKAGADVILLVANAPEGAAAVKTMSALKPQQRLPILSHWGIAGGAFVEKAGIDNLQKVELEVLQTFSFLLPQQREKKQRLLERYRRLSGTDVTAETIPAAVGVAHAYDLVHLLAMAIEQAKSTESERTRAALESIGEYQGLVKVFKPPFSAVRHDALEVDDYIMAEFNPRGYLVPVSE